MPSQINFQKANVAKFLESPSQQMQYSSEQPHAKFLPSRQDDNLDGTLFLKPPNSGPIQSQANLMTIKIQIPTMHHLRS